MASVSASNFQPLEYDTAMKVLADSSNLKVVPSQFNIITDPTALSSDSLPIIDFSALTSNDHDQRSKTIHDLGKACQEWGFFILVNHGIPEALMNATFTAVKEFFNLPESEKKQYQGKSVSDPIKCGNFSVSTTSNETITFWRENLKIFHPKLHCPLNPPVLREVLLEYTERTGGLAKKLMEAASENLELEQEYVDGVLKLDSSFQQFAANLYPPCPQPDRAIGLPPHKDPGLLTLLIHNGVPGLQIEHNGQWFSVTSPQNSILVNVADQLEIFTNGRYKSVKHRAIVNSERERISIVMGNGPSNESVVKPAAPLVKKDGSARVSYRPMTYGEYVEAQLMRPRINT